MTYKESIDYLFSRLPMFSRVGAAAYKPGLGTSLALDAFYGHPHTKYKTIHIAGTNGKGSTSHLLASMLQAQGYRTGLYTSPHLVDFRERMRVDGQMIPEKDVVDFVERFKSSGYEGSPSFFELTMMMAFDWFAKENVDYAVIEVGMGGRLDSTNIITPEACVITNIQWDHTQFLGDTLPKIAREKSGIIKKGIPVVIGEAQGEVREVFEQKAMEVDAPIHFAEDADVDIEAYECPLGGDYQKANRRTVLTAVEMLREVGIKLSEEAVKEGMRSVVERTGLRGRWMKVNDTPLTICDTGHNEAGLRYNISQLRRLLSGRPKATLRMLIGFVADKDIDKLLGMLPKEAVYYVTNAQIPRALPAATLLEKVCAAGLSATMYPCVSDAYKAARRDCAADDILFIGGSTFIVADFLALE